MAIGGTILCLFPRYKKRYQSKWASTKPSQRNSLKKTTTRRSSTTCSTKIRVGEKRDEQDDQADDEPTKDDSDEFVGRNVLENEKMTEVSRIPALAPLELGARFDHEEGIDQEVVEVVGIRLDQSRLEHEAEEPKGVASSASSSTSHVNSSGGLSPFRQDHPTIRPGRPGSADEVAPVSPITVPEDWAEAEGSHKDIVSGGSLITSIEGEELMGSSTASPPVTYDDREGLPTSPSKTSSIWKRMSRSGSQFSNFSILKKPTSSTEDLSRATAKNETGKRVIKTEMKEEDGTNVGSSSTHISSSPQSLKTLREEGNRTMMAMEVERGVINTPISRPRPSSSSSSSSPSLLRPVDQLSIGRVGGIAGIGTRDRSSLGAYHRTVDHRLSHVPHQKRPISAYTPRPLSAYSPSTSSPLSTQIVEQDSEILQASSSSSNQSTSSAPGVLLTQARPRLRASSNHRNSSSFTQNRLSVIPDRMMTSNSEDLMKLLRGPSAYPEEARPKSVIGSIYSV